MLHPILEIAHFMNWADFYVAFEVRLLASSYFCPVHELDRKIAQFVKWAISRMGCNIYNQKSITN
jgi:hypothetical protein